MRVSDLVFRLHVGACFQKELHDGIVRIGRGRLNQGCMPKLPKNIIIIIMIIWKNDANKVK